MRTEKKSTTSSSTDRRPERNASANPLAPSESKSTWSRVASGTSAKEPDAKSKGSEELPKVTAQRAKPAAVSIPELKAPAPLPSWDADSDDDMSFGLPKTSNAWTRPTQESQDNPWVQPPKVSSTFAPTKIMARPEPTKEQIATKLAENERQMAASAERVRLRRAEEERIRQEQIQQTKGKADKYVTTARDRPETNRRRDSDRPPAQRRGENCQLDRPLRVSRSTTAPVQNLKTDVPQPAKEPVVPTKEHVKSILASQQSEMAASIERAILRKTQDEKEKEEQRKRATERANALAAEQEALKKAKEEKVEREKTSIKEQLDVSKYVIETENKETTNERKPRPKRVLKSEISANWRQKQPIESGGGKSSTNRPQKQFNRRERRQSSTQNPNDSPPDTVDSALSTSIQDLSVSNKATTSSVGKYSSITSSKPKPTENLEAINKMSDQQQNLEVNGPKPSAKSQRGGGGNTKRVAKSPSKAEPESS